VADMCSASKLVVEGAREDLRGRHGLDLLIANGLRHVDGLLQRLGVVRCC
jgi:hypothetical protein